MTLKKSHENILLTGIPRSGSSMLCVFLNQIPGVLALNEGLRLGGLETTQQAREHVYQAYADIRAQVLHNGTAPARHKNGVQVTNHFTREAGQRSLMLQKSDIRVDKPLQPDFMLGIKHNAGFTLALEALLVLKWPIFALIRNPLAVLGSWNSLAIPVSQGRVRGMETRAPNLAAQVEAAPDMLRKQVVILDYCFGQYHAFVKPECLLRYEDLCKQPAKVLRKIVNDRDVSALRPTENLNTSPIYPLNRFPEFEEALCELPEAKWRLFYSEQELRALRAEIEEK